MPPVKISFFLSEPTPYYNLLFSDLLQRDVLLTINYLHSKLKHHPWNISDTYGKLEKNYYCESILATIVNISKQLIHQKPDIMLVAGYYDIKLILTFVLLKLFGVPFAFYSDTPQLFGNRSRLKSRIRDLLLGWIFRNAKFILSTGQVGLEAFKALGCPEAKLKNLPCVVDLDAPRDIDQESKNYALRLREKFASAGTLIFICAGQLIPRKGYDVAINSFAKAAQQWPGRQAVLLMAGEGPEMGELEEMVRALGLSERVHFLGWLQLDNFKGFFQAADILIHPARWDPFPLVVLEAMSWGLPVLASDQTMAAVDRVRHGESGFIHHVDDAEALAGHIAYFLEDPARVRQMGAKAREIAEQWPVSRCVQTILELL